MLLGLIFLINFLFCVFLQCCESKSINNSSTEEQLSVATLKHEVDILKERINNLTNIYEKDKANEKKAVLFFVRLSTSITLTQYSVVKFDEAVINEGNHFNTGDGVFVAPVSGIYQFTWTTITSSSNKVETELRVDNVVKDRSFVLASGGYIPATKVALCSVKKGDHVWIQTTGNYAANFFSRPNPGVGSTFTGMLIHY